MPQLIFNLTSPQADRLAAALGTAQGRQNGDGTPRDATTAEVREYTIDQWRTLIRSEERKAQERLIQPAAFDPT